jgi:hypothetical protein
MHRIIEVLALLHFDLGRPADTDYGDPACRLGETLLQFLAIIIRGRFRASVAFARSNSFIGPRGAADRAA